MYTMANLRYFFLLEEYKHSEEGVDAMYVLWVAFSCYTMFSCVHVRKTLANESPTLVKIKINLVAQKFVRGVCLVGRFLIPKFYL